MKWIRSSKYNRFIPQMQELATVFEWHHQGKSIELKLGDVTTQECDAIVNAANSRLAGGGGVDGAIHRRGGPTIMEETRQRYPDGCPTGAAVITAAGNLPVKFVIHAVGPVWSGGDRKESDLLRSAYWRSLELASENGCHTVAFPSLSTGAYRYPVDQASQIALSTCMEYLQHNATPQRVIFVLFDESTLSTFSKTLATL